MLIRELINTVGIFWFCIQTCAYSVSSFASKGMKNMANGKDLAIQRLPATIFLNKKFYRIELKLSETSLFNLPETSLLLSQSDFNEIIAPVIVSLMMISAILVTSLSSSGKGNTSPHSPSTRVLNTGETYTFDPKSLKNDGHVTPQYLVSGILAGLQILPPEVLLSKQSGYGRRISYDTYRKLYPEWLPIQKPIRRTFSSIEVSKSTYTSDAIESIQYCNVPRIVSLPNALVYSSEMSSDLGQYLGSFRLYKVKLVKSIANSINIGLTKVSFSQLKSSSGIAVTNAGGYHGITTLFENEDRDESISMISSIIEDAVAQIELDDHCQSVARNEDYVIKYSQSNIRNDIHQMSTQITPTGNDEGIPSDVQMSRNVRRLQKKEDSESWINISGHGCWNRLHTHAGSTWSGVYYVQSNRDCVPEDKAYSGQLIIKPSPHSSQHEIYKLSDEEKARLNCYPIQDKEIIHHDNQALIERLPRPTRCEYIEILPEEGTMVVFPSWLYHAVLPLSLSEAHREEETGLRISLAFNFAENFETEDISSVLV